MRGQPPRILLTLSEVTKTFPGVKALDRVTFNVVAGEVHGLIGENGAGKSTLMSIASGLLRADSGSVVIDDDEIVGDPDLARSAGLAIVRQEPSLMPDLSVAENMFLGLPERLRPPIAEMNLRADASLHNWSEAVTVTAKDRVRDLKPEERFIVDIVKALTCEPKVLVLDEPTEHLHEKDVERLFGHVRRLASQGRAIVYISHRIREVQAIADRVTVLREGKVQGTHDAGALSEDQIVSLIVGSSIDREFPAKSGIADGGQITLSVDGLGGPGFTDVSLRMHRGEIVGLAGVDGNGQRKFICALAGLVSSRGRLELSGVPISVTSPAAAARNGIRYVPGDRLREGIFSGLSVRENFSIRNLAEMMGFGIVNRWREAASTKQAVSRFSVKTPDIETLISSLSGGNQQKLVLASALQSGPRLLLIEEPTQGVDVGTRMEIYGILRAAADKGLAIIVLSSNIQEIAGLSDRVLVFSRGRVVRTLEGGAVTEEDITAAALTATGTRTQTPGIDRLRSWAGGETAPLVSVLVATVLLTIFATLNNELFLSSRNVAGMMVLIAPLAIVSYGQQIIMLVGGIDLSVGPLIGLVQVIASFYLVTGAGTGDAFLGCGLIVAAALIVGFVNWLLADPLGLHPMIATLATFMAVQAISLILRPVPAGVIDIRVMDALATRVGFVPLSMILAMMLALLLEYLLLRHTLGLSFRGLGSNAHAARSAGISHHRIRMTAYMGCSLLAALAAVTLISQVGIGDQRAGIGYTLTSIAVVVVGGASLFGGRGSFVGALLGAIFLTEINAITTFLNLAAEWQSYVLGTMIILAVSVYSRSRRTAIA